ncbi:MAG: hydroxymethylbilane synthase [Vicinamibacterales bacterium]
MERLRIGTRGSELALFQANAVAALLADRAGVETEVVVIRTSGDRLAEASLAEIGGKRLFVKEIEDALLAGTVDIAVHSSKDLPAVLPDGLALGAVLERDDPRDAVVLPGATGRVLSLEALVAHLGRAPRIGTSSIRRIAQLTRLFPAAEFLPIRGNVATRLAKLDAGGFDALVLAAAGLRRLGYHARIATPVPVAACVPAPGQGIIAVEYRAADAWVAERLLTITHEASAAALEAERAVVTELGGGCQMPIGACAEVDEDTIGLTTVVTSPDGARSVRVEVRGLAADPRQAGLQAAGQLLAEGAGAILHAVRATQPGASLVRPE